MVELWSRSERHPLSSQKPDSLTHCFTCAKWKLLKQAFSEVWSVFFQTGLKSLSLPSHYPISLSHGSQSSLSVSALVRGSLGCSGLSGKLLHQIRVSSTGCLTVWLLQSCPAILQKTHSQPLWRALMKSMAWAPAAFDSVSKESYMIE